MRPHVSHHSPTYWPIGIACDAYRPVVACTCAAAKIDVVLAPIGRYNQCGVSLDVRCCVVMLASNSFPHPPDAAMSDPELPSDLGGDIHLRLHCHEPDISVATMQQSMVVSGTCRAYAEHMPSICLCSTLYDDSMRNIAILSQRYISFM